MDIKVKSAHTGRVKRGIVYRLYIQKDSIVLEQAYDGGIKQTSVLPQNIKKGIPNKNGMTRVKFELTSENKYVVAHIPAKIVKYIRIPNTIYKGDRVLYRCNEYYAKPKGEKCKLYKHIKDLIDGKSCDEVAYLKNIPLMKPLEDDMISSI